MDPILMIFIFTICTHHGLVVSNFTIEQINDFNQDVNSLFQEGSDLLAKQKKERLATIPKSDTEISLVNIVEHPLSTIEEFVGEVKEGFEEFKEDVELGYTDVRKDATEVVESWASGLYQKIKNELIWVLLFLIVFKWVLGEIRKHKFNRKVDRRIANQETMIELVEQQRE